MSEGNNKHISKTLERLEQNGIIVKIDKPELNDLARSERRIQHLYDVSAKFNNKHEIEDPFELMAFIINAYLSSRNELSLCGFLEDDHFGNSDIVSLAPYYLNWIDDSKKVFSFRYWIYKESPDILYVKISKFTDDSVHIMMMSKYNNQELKVVTQNMPTTLSGFSNLNMIALQLSQSLGSKLSDYGVRNQSDIILEQIHDSNINRKYREIDF